MGNTFFLDTNVMVDNLTMISNVRAMVSPYLEEQSDKELDTLNIEVNKQYLELITALAVKRDYDPTELVNNMAKYQERLQDIIIARLRNLTKI